MPTQFQPDSALGDSISQGIRDATGYKPVLKSDLKKGYKPYREKFGRIKDTDSDLKLYGRAVRKVIAWWKRQQRDEAARGKPPKVPPGVRPDMNGPAGGGGGFSGGGGGGAGGGGLPDTATGFGGSGNMPLPAIRTPAEQDRLARNLAQGTERETPHLVGPAQIKRVLDKYGISYDKPIPPYALQNATALKNWAIRVVTKREANLADKAKREARKRREQQARLRRRVATPRGGDVPF